MQRRLIIGLVVGLFLFYATERGRAMGRILFRIPRHKVDIEGAVQDAGGNPLNDVTLHIGTEILTKPFSSETKIDHYKRTVSGKFRLKLPKKVHSMWMWADKEGYAPTSEYHFDADTTNDKPETLQAKDVVIRLIPAVRQSRLYTGSAWPKITKEGKCFGFSFKKWREIPMKGKPNPADMWIYLEVTGKPDSYEDTSKYSVALAGGGIKFCEASLLPPLKYVRNHQRFRDELLQAPEDGYVARIEIDDPDKLGGRYFYFRTQDGKYGKLWIESVEATDRLQLSITYYHQPDGTRDLAQEPILSSVF